MWRWVVPASVVSAAVLSVLWRTMSSASPPLYEGVCLSPPYLFTGANPPPSAATASFPASASFPNYGLKTNELQAQAQVLLMNGTLISPSSPFTLSLSAVPVAAPPAGWHFDANVYRVAAVTSGGAALQPAAGEPVTLVLRAATSGAQDTMFRLDGGSWTQLHTVTFGCAGTFESTSPVLGDFVLMTQQNTAEAGAGGVVVPLVIALCAVVVMTIAGLFVLRRRAA